MEIGGGNGGGSGSSVTITEQDGSPSGVVTLLKVTNGTLTDNGGGSFSLATGGGSGTPGGSDTQVQYNNASTFGGITGATTNGTTLTLVAPVLGTPASVTLTNATGTAASLTAGKATILATARTIAGVSFDGSANISIASTGLSDTANIDYLNQTQTLTGIKTFSPTARASGVASYLTINAPADTGQTAATESIGLNIVGATRTWADGTVTTQREYLFQKPTYNKTTAAATFTNAATVAISGAPAAGAGVTLTHPWSLWVQAGNSHFGAQVGATQIGILGSGAEFNDSNNTTGGHVVEIQNTSNGTSAFSGVSLGNDQTVDGGATTHFAGLFWNSSTYSDTTFGTAFAIPSLAALQNSDGPVAISAQNGTGYVNFIAGGSASTNEVGRFTTTGLTVGLAGTLTGKVRFAGSTSNYIDVVGVAAGGSTTNTLQAVTDTFVYKATTDTLTNKRNTKRVVTVNAPGATPTTNTDNGDIFEFTGLNAAITSMTTNLSGTPINGDMAEFVFVDNATARAITWGASFANGGLVNLPTTTVLSVVLRVLVQYQTIATLNKWVCIAVS